MIVCEGDRSQECNERYRHGSQSIRDRIALPRKFLNISRNKPAQDVHIDEVRILDKDADWFTRTMYMLFTYVTSFHSNQLLLKWTDFINNADRRINDNDDDGKGFVLL